MELDAVVDMLDRLVEDCRNQRLVALVVTSATRCVHAWCEETMRAPALQTCP